LNASIYQNSDIQILISFYVTGRNSYLFSKHKEQNQVYLNVTISLL